MSVLDRKQISRMALAEILSKNLDAGDVVLLFGEMGAGKTHFVSLLAGLLGVKEHVTSPTYTLIHEYQAQTLQLVHVDLYRLKEVDEMLIADILHPEKIALIEWPERLQKQDYQAFRVFKIFLKASDYEHADVEFPDDLKYNPGNYEKS